MKEDATIDFRAWDVNCKYSFLLKIEAKVQGFPSKRNRMENTPSVLKPHTGIRRQGIEDQYKHGGRDYSLWLLGSRRTDFDKEVIIRVNGIEFFLKISYSMQFLHE